jgi:hypothetical protein
MCMTVATFFAILIAMSAAWAQIALEPPPPVRNSIPEPQKSALETEKHGLEARRSVIESGVAKLGADCSRVDAQDAVRVSECSGRNHRLREDIHAYRQAVAAYKCRLAEPTVLALKRDIAGNEEAIRKIGLGPTVEAYERLAQMTKDQKIEFESAMLEATLNVLLSSLVDVIKAGTVAAASTGTAQGRHYAKLAADYGLDDPRLLNAIKAFSETRDKPEMARQLNEIIDRIKLLGQASLKAYKAGGAKTDADRAWKLAGLAMVLAKEVAPKAAERLAQQFPSLAVDIAKNLTIKTGLAVASPAVTFAHNMRVLGYTRQAVEQLDIATDHQLRAIDILHERMKRLVGEVKEQRSVLAGCSR